MILYLGSCHAVIVRVVTVYREQCGPRCEPTNLCVTCSRSGDSGLPASLQNVYRTPVHSSSSSTAVSVPGSSSASSSRVKWHRSCSVRETAPIGPSEFVELYRSRAYSDPRQQDRQAALAARRRRVGHVLSDIDNLWLMPVQS